VYVFALQNSALAFCFPFISSGYKAAKQNPELYTYSRLHMYSLKIKDKVKFTLEQATKAQKGSRGLTLLFL
jgi:hypothetical protein